jgi:hypothetical protein
MDGNASSMEEKSTARSALFRGTGAPTGSSKAREAYEEESLEMMERGNEDRISELGQKVSRLKEVRNVGRKCHLNHYKKHSHSHSLSMFVCLLG